MESKQLISAATTPTSNPSNSLQFEIVVFHRQNEITVVAIVPRLQTAVLGNNSNPEPTNNPTFSDQFQRLLSTFMGRVMSRDMQEFWDRALDTQAGLRATPASQKSINALPTNQIQPFERILSDRCTVCQENYQIGDKITHLPCGHTFHRECVIQWLKQKNSCPLCRAKIDNGDDKKIEGGVLKTDDASEEKDNQLRQIEGNSPTIAWIDSKVGEGKSDTSNPNQVTNTSRVSVVPPSLLSTTPTVTPLPNSVLPNRRGMQIHQHPQQVSEQGCCTIS
mmetsp:Transcript_30903/g.43069  ORF Transcript_30903/g.43069 Transcript_30903/m.43069 type:complete len:278 (-) Transcript_30903:413-1246(-)|eukprot:CAMPEP_0185270254 /NCGR_PEP_ID=MMETSP1359-20130426/41857_1 /TAXON_ID=552665 /ORGANISM="Bigelowiella longifila, Strain CCMP242" /LENGTH=277 /DNA_ID=CAMNT_0027861731 /DNA_START=141 /DNA_END=974 /DNA_ORIENTATION=-